LVGYLIFIILKEKKITQNNTATALFAFSVVNVFGIINEFLEFFVRVSILNIPKEEYLIRFSAYYSDTMYDLITNFVAALIVLLIILFVTQKNEK
jgi:hypothetical protein